MRGKTTNIGRVRPGSVFFGLLISVLGAGTALAGHAVVKDPAAAGAAYNETCVACHGPDGRGAIPGMPDFTKPDGPLSKPDEVLLKHMTEGFASGKAPISMPARGGNPGLSDAELADLLGYIRNKFEH